MASYMLVRHKVRDFKEWKSGYRSKRDETGLTEVQLLRNDQDPNEVIALFEAQNLDDARTFASSEDLKQTMQKVGVIDKLDIYFLNQ